MSPIPMRIVTMSSGRVNPLFRQEYGPGRIVVGGRYPVMVKRFSVRASRSGEGYLVRKRSRFESGEEPRFRVFPRGILRVRDRSSGRNREIERGIRHEASGSWRRRIHELLQISGEIFGTDLRFHAFGILFESEVGIDRSVQHEGQNHDRDHGFREGESVFSKRAVHSVWIIGSLPVPEAVSRRSTRFLSRNRRSSAAGR